MGGHSLTDAGPLVILGATGSIGRQAIEVAERLGREVVALGARQGSDMLVSLAERFPEARVVAAAPTNQEHAMLRDRLGSRYARGPEELEELARTAAVVVNGIVGSAGLPASVAALESGNRLALANKESLVAGGPVVLAAAERGGGEIVPVDSEHSALFQCLQGEEPSSVTRLILTASGGPFRDRADLSDVTLGEALAHPTWNMGPRITIDSSTLMNKAFEVIEAHLLFGISYDAIDVVVHPQSIVHSMVEFADGSTKAHVGEPDMRVPIQYAITYPDRAPGGEPFDWSDRTLTFEKPDFDRFPLLGLGYDAGRAGGSAPATMNAADEIAVQAFIDGRISYGMIATIVEMSLERMGVQAIDTVADVLAIDTESRNVAAEIAGSC